MTNPLEQTADEALALIWQIRERALIAGDLDAVDHFDAAIVSLRAGYCALHNLNLAMARAIIAQMAHPLTQGMEA